MHDADAKCAGMLGVIDANRSPVEPNLAAIRSMEAREDLDERRLPRTILAD
jgi:hypothetical protein